MHLKNCTSLETVEFGNGIETIYVSAFEGCTSLKRVEFGDSLKTLGRYVFSDCTSLTEIILPDKDLEMSESSFFNIGYYLDEDNWEDEMLYIGVHLIAGNTTNSQKDYVIKVGTKTIAKYAMSRCKFRSTSLPDGLLRIDEGAFWGSESNGNTFSTLVIPETVEYIGDDAFDYCKWIGTCIFKDTPSYMANQYSAFDYCSGIKTVEIQKGVVPDFSSCENLSTVILGKGVTGFRDGAFMNTMIEEIVIPDGIKVLSGHLFQNCKKLKSVTLPASLEKIDSAAFQGCNLLSEINPGENVTEIEWNAFSGTGITEFVIPPLVRKIDDNLFTECTNLRKVHIPMGVYEIGMDAFEGCDTITDVYFEGPPVLWDHIVKKAGNSALKKVVLHTK